jgi:hypothetical protein
MTRTKRSHSRRRSAFRRHSLGATVAAIVLLWLILYRGGDPSSHIGAFYGNALADWLGTLVLVIATKYLYEIGSAESRPPHPGSRGALARFLIDHSLTIGLVITGAAWIWFYARIDANGKTGQVVGNIVSEWTQLLGIVVITKYTREIGSKESR